MTWLHNPFFTAKSDRQARTDPEEAIAAPDPTATPATAGASAEAGGDSGDEADTAPLRRVLSVPIQAPTESLTGYQFFYIFILDGVGAFILSGGINFAIAYGEHATPSA
jgi:hypothetical protein